MLSYRYNAAPLPVKKKEPAKLSRNDFVDNLIRRIEDYQRRHGGMSDRRLSLKIDPLDAGKLCRLKNCGINPRKETIDKIERVIGADNGQEEKVSNSSFRL